MHNGDVRAAVLFLLFALLLCGDTFKMYLKDGGYHSVREYQVEGDRVRYYSTERGDWEEIPKELVDLDKTEKERKARNASAVQEARAEDEEEKAQREQQRQIAAIPVEPGAYYKTDGEVKTLKQSQYQIVTDKKRHLIQVLSPVPLIPGHASVVIEGDHSDFRVREARPDFFLRLDKEEQFGIVSLTPKKNVRVVENISIIPVSKENVEDRKQISTFEQQLADGLYRVWPQKELPAGEYALIQYANQADLDGTGEIEIMIWDFALRPK